MKKPRIVWNFLANEVATERNALKLNFLINFRTFFKWNFTLNAIFFKRAKTLSSKESRVLLESTKFALFEAAAASCALYNNKITTRQCLKRFLQTIIHRHGFWSEIHPWDTRNPRELFSPDKASLFIPKAVSVEINISSRLKLFCLKTFRMTNSKKKIFKLELLFPPFPPTHTSSKPKEKRKKSWKCVFRPLSLRY